MNRQKRSVAFRPIFLRVGIFYNDLLQNVNVEGI